MSETGRSLFDRTVYKVRNRNSYFRKVSHSPSPNNLAQLSINHFRNRIQDDWGRDYSATLMQLQSLVKGLGNAPVSRLTYTSRIESRIKEKTEN